MAASLAAGQPFRSGRGGRQARGDAGRRPRSQAPQRAALPCPRSPSSAVPSSTPARAPGAAEEPFAPVRVRRATDLADGGHERLDARRTAHGRRFYASGSGSPGGGRPLPRSGPVRSHGAADRRTGPAPRTGRLCAAGRPGIARRLPTRRHAVPATAAPTPALDRRSTTVSPPGGRKAEPLGSSMVAHGVSWLLTLKSGASRF